jgi:hypothetical protein
LPAEDGLVLVLRAEELKLIVVGPDETLLVQGLFAPLSRYTFPSTSKCHTKHHKHTNTHTHTAPIVLVE